MVCMGNICRSPMAAAVLSNRTADWIKPKVIVDSSGTSAFHIGQGAHPTSQKLGKKLDTSTHTLREVLSQVISLSQI